MSTEGFDEATFSSAEAVAAAEAAEGAAPYFCDWACTNGSSDSDASATDFASLAPTDASAADATLEADVVVVQAAEEGAEAAAGAEAAEAADLVRSWAMIRVIRSRIS
jgi:hypothetical protein